MARIVAAAAEPLAQGVQAGQVLLLVFYLALLIAGAYLVTRLYGRIARGGGVYSAKADGRESGRLRLVDRLPLGRDHSVLVIDHDGKRYLVGMTQESFTLLDKGEAPEQPAAAQELPQRRQPFADVMSAWRKQGDEKDAP